jgi:hypothetical protein
LGTVPSHRVLQGHDRDHADRRDQPESRHRQRGGAWADAEVTREKLKALFEGEIVASHPGTQDGRWECAYEFYAIGHDQAVHKYRWVLLGLQSRAVIDANPAATVKGVQLATRLHDAVPKEARGPDASIPSSFQLLDLLPPPAQSTVQLEVARPPQPPVSQRRFAQMAGLSLVSPDTRAASLATVLRLIFRRALVHTSDLRLLPSATPLVFFGVRAGRRRRGPAA